MKKNILKKVTGIVMSVAVISTLVGCGNVDTATVETAVASMAFDEGTVADSVIEEVLGSSEDFTASEETEFAEEFVGDEEMGDYPDNFMEERSGKFVFDSYDEIVSLLNDGEAYGYAKVLGADEEVLFITDETFDGYGEPASISVFPYLKNANGKYECASVISSASTSTPVSVTKDGRILSATHTEVSVSAVDQDTKGIMVMTFAYVDWGEDGSNPTYGGFVRETNSVYADQKDIAADDSSVFDDTFAEFDSATPIWFTVVGK